MNICASTFKSAICQL